MSQNQKSECSHFGFLRFSLLAMSLAITSARALDAATIARVDSLFQPFSQPNCPGASVAIIRKGKVVFAKAYGLANLEQGIPCTTNTNFRLASVTKQFTAMAVLILADHRKITLNETLTDLFPEFPAYGREITVRQMLTHTSGLIDYEDVIPKGTSLPVLDQDVLRLMMTQDHTYFPPGTKYRYSNTAYALLAMAVEQRSGMTFATFLQRHIFKPLTMNHTVAYEAGFHAVPDRARGYAWQDNRFVDADQSLTSSVLGDGGIYSSVSDLAKWDAALYTTKLIKARTLRAVFTPQILTDRPGRSYGFGWNIETYRGMKEVWHSGHTSGFTTRITRYPERRFSVILLTNRANAPLEEIPHQIVDLLISEVNPER